MNEIPQDFMDAVAAEQAAMRETGLGALDASTSRGLINDIRMRLSRMAGGNWTPEDPASSSHGATGGFGVGYGQTPAPEGWGASGGADILAALRELVKASGGRGGVDMKGIDKASKDDYERLKGLLEKIQSVRAGLGAYDAQKPLTKVFDAAAEYDRLKKANPESRPDNTNYWRGQAMPVWVGGERGFSAYGDMGAAARLMRDIDTDSYNRNQKDIERLLGFAREKSAGENLNAQEDFARNRAPLSTQMPGEIDLNIMKAMQKMPTELLKAQLRAQSQAGKETALSQMADAMTVGIKRGLIDPNTMKPIGEGGKQFLAMIGLGKPAVAPKIEEQLKFNEAFASSGLPQSERDRYFEYVMGGGEPSSRAKYARALEQYAKSKNPKAFDPANLQ